MEFARAWEIEWLAELVERQCGRVCAVRFTTPFDSWDLQNECARVDGVELANHYRDDSQIHSWCTRRHVWTFSLRAGRCFLLVGWRAIEEIIFVWQRIRIRQKILVSIIHFHIILSYDVWLWLWKSFKNDETNSFESEKSKIDPVFAIDAEIDSLSSCCCTKCLMDIAANSFVIVSFNSDLSSFEQLSYYDY